MFCNKCGQEIQNERGFCSRCNINPTPEMPSFPDTALAWWKILLIWIFVFCCPVLGSIIVIILSAILYYAKRKTYPRRANSLLVNGWLILIFGLALSYNRLQNGGFYMCKYPNFILQCSDLIDCFSLHDSPMQDGPKKHIPRARIEGTVPSLVIDEDCVLFQEGAENIEPCLPRVPVIIGVDTTKLSDKNEIMSCKPAMDVIMQTVQNFPDIQITTIDISNCSQMHIHLCYRTKYTYFAIFPLTERKNDLYLTALQSAIIHAQRNNREAQTFDLTQEGLVIVR